MTTIVVVVILVVISGKILVNKNSFNHSGVKITLSRLTVFFLFVLITSAIKVNFFMGNAC